MHVDPQVNPYAGQTNQSNLHILCRTNQPDLHFVSQVWDKLIQDRLTRIVIPKYI